MCDSITSGVIIWGGGGGRDGRRGVKRKGEMGGGNVLKEVSGRKAPKHL